MPAQSSVRNTATVTNPGTQSSVAGTVVSLQIEASDSAGGQTLTYTAAGLPPGLSINSADGVISGVIPDGEAGSFPVTVTAKDATGASGSAAFTWTLHNKVTLFGVEVVGSTDTEVSFSPVEASDSAGGQTLTYTAAGLPPGLSINSSTGVISGTTPSTPETFSVTVKAEDTTGASGSATFAWNVFPKLTIINPGTQDSGTDTAVSLQIKASESPARDSLAYWAAGLPPGLSINRSTGLISGTTPSTAGNFTVTVSVAAALSVSATFNWVVHNIVAVTNPGSQTSVIGAAVSLQIKASESPTPRTLSYSGGVFPSGLSLNSSTGLISGVISDGAAGSSRSRCRPKTPQARPGQRRSSGSCSPMWG